MSTQAKREGNARYIKKLDTLSLRMPKGKKLMIKLVAAGQNKSTNQFILDAIDAEIDRINKGK